MDGFDSIRLDSIGLDWIGWLFTVRYHTLLTENGIYALLHTQIAGYFLFLWFQAILDHILKGSIRFYRDKTKRVAFFTIGNEFGTMVKATILRSVVSCHTYIHTYIPPSTRPNFHSVSYIYTTHTHQYNTIQYNTIQYHTTNPTAACDTTRPFSGIPSTTMRMSTRTHIVLIFVLVLNR